MRMFVVTVAVHPCVWRQQAVGKEQSEKEGRNLSLFPDGTAQKLTAAVVFIRDSLQKPL